MVEHLRDWPVLPGVNAVPGSLVRPGHHGPPVRSSRPATRQVRINDTASFPNERPATHKGVWGQWSPGKATCGLWLS